MLNAQIYNQSQLKEALEYNTGEQYNWTSKSGPPSTQYPKYTIFPIWWYKRSGITSHSNWGVICMGRINAEEQCQPSQMKPTLWYVTLLYSILIQPSNLYISKHTPNQENYFSCH